MEPELTNEQHRELRELLGAYALGAVSPDEGRKLAAHLDTCWSCQAELEELHTAVQAVPLSVPELEPPPGLRGSILAAIEADTSADASPATPTAFDRARQEPQAPPVTPPPPIPISQQPRNISWIPWAAAAALLVLSIGLLAWNVTLRDDDTPGPPTIALEATSQDVEGGGEVAWLEEEGVLVVTLHDVPVLSEGQVYQAWVIVGDTPVSAGVIPSGSDTLAFAGNPEDYDIFAITVEPGPIGVPAPTSPPILAAELGFG